MLQSHNARYVAIAHTWDSGAIDYINVLDNKELTTEALDGRMVPDWFRERVALLRLCEVNKTARGESIGRRFTEHMIYVYLDKKEHKQLSKLIDTGEREDEAEAKAEVEETDSQER
jgi:hypothetical protein